MPETATLTAVRATYARGSGATGSVTVTVLETDLATGAPVTTTLATRTASSGYNTYVSDVLTMPTPRVVTATKRIHVSIVSSTTLNTAAACGVTPIYTLP